MSQAFRNDIFGCLVDVSGSMREALEAGRSDERATERLQSVLQTILQTARIKASRDPGASMFIRIFGLNQDQRYPPAIDLCKAVKELLEIAREDMSGHDLLVKLANEQDRAYISKYIRSKLTDDQARIVHRYLRQHPAEIGTFIRAIPTGADVERSKQYATASGSIATTIGLNYFLGSAVFAMCPILAPAAVATGPILGAMAGAATCDSVQDSKADKSEALELAKRIWFDWWQGFTTSEPLPIAEVVDLLHRLQERSVTLTTQTDGVGGAVSQGLAEQSSSAQCSKQTNEKSQEVRHQVNTKGAKSMLDWLRPYIYGSTPLRQALSQALEVFPDSDADQPDSTKALLVISDGFSTDGDPQKLVYEFQEKKVKIAAIYLTNDPAIAQRRLFDNAMETWDQGQHTLFNICSRVIGNAQPIPVLASMGWKLPSSGTSALYTHLYTVEALEEFCSVLVSAKLDSGDSLLEILGRVKLDNHISEKHMRVLNNPSNQGQEAVCFAHAAAAVIHMALSRIWGRDGGYPDIHEIRTRILAEFPQAEGGRFMEKILERATDPTWYRPLRFREVGEDDARQAILRRQPVLTTFHLSKTGWDIFSRHFEAETTACSILTHNDMKAHRSEDSDGGHAVVLTNCGPGSLTFLNSWGRDWGNRGSFSVESISVLELEGYPARFYQVYWLEDDLTEPERTGYYATRYPEFFQLEERCPVCNERSRIIEFTGTIHRAVCPNCHESFTPEPGYLIEALCLQSGLCDAV